MSQPFRVSVPVRETQRLKHWAEWCKHHGIENAFIHALEIIDYRLLMMPLDDWSEPFRDVISLKLQLRFGAVDMVGVEYGVHENQNDVFVKQFKWIGKVKPPDSV